MVIKSLPGVKRPGRDQPTPCSVEVKEKSCTSAPSLDLLGLFWAELYLLPTPVPDCKPTFLGKGEALLFLTYLPFDGAAWWFGGWMVGRSTLEVGIPSLSLLASVGSCTLHVNAEILPCAETL